MRERGALLVAHVDELEVADVLGEDDIVGSEGGVDDVLGLYIVEGVDKLMSQLLDMLAGDALLIYEFAQTVAIYIVGDNAAAYARHILVIVDHHDIRM